MSGVEVIAVSKWPEVETKLDLVTAWARDGLIDEDIMSNLGISKPTFYQYIKEHSNFSNALKIGKEVTDITVVNALYKRTQGYRYDEVTTESMPIYTDGNITGYEMRETKRVTKEVLPDPTSMIFWLKNRCKEQWRDKREVESTIEVKVPILKEIQDTFANARRLHSVEVVDIEIVGGE